MYREHKICLIIPAYNEEKQIGKVLSQISDIVDQIIVVNDGSKDKTAEEVIKYQNQDARIHLINHEKNQGTGAARISGIRKSLKMDIDIMGFVDGDGQMDLNELTSLLDPIIEDQADLVKGNRFFSGEAWDKMPRMRYYGNATLSLLTKIASGYWHIADFQTGYIVMRKIIAERIDLDHLYTSYGFPNDLLIHANVANARAIDLPIKPLYNVGEKSSMKIWKVIPKLSWLIIQRFFWRLKERYIKRDFHPLVLFYLSGFVFGLITIALSIRMFIMWGINGKIPPINALAAMFSFMSTTLFILFAMWFDMEYNRRMR